MPDFEPTEWNDGDTFTADDASEIARELEEQESDWRRLHRASTATAVGTAAKTITLPETLISGDFLLLTFTSGSTSTNPTVSINGGAAISIRTASGSTSSTFLTAEANSMWLLYFDGTYLRPVGLQNSVSTSLSTAEVDAGTSTGARIITPTLAAYIGRYVRTATITSSATPTPPDVATTMLFTVTAQAAAAAFAAPLGTPVNGQELVIRYKDNGTARALTWNAIYRAIGVTLPTTTVINKTTYVFFRYNSTDTKWDCIDVRQEA